MKRVVKGFTLVELMVTVAIIGILASIAIPQYRDYVLQSRLVDAVSALSSVQPAADHFWMNKRTFTDFDRMPANTANFDYTFVPDAATPKAAYLATATGKNQALGFVYTVDQQGKRRTTAVKAGYGTAPADCWIIKKGGACSQ